MNSELNTGTLLSLSSLFLTAFIALFLFIVPGMLIGFVFGIYADFNAIANKGIWLGQIETVVAMTFAIYFLILPTGYFITRSLSEVKSVTEYLNLKWHAIPSITQVKFISLIFWVLFTALGFLIGLPEEPFMDQLKNSQLPIWFICLNVCVMAPIVEEVVFRGFLFKRVELTKLGTIGAAITTSILFAAIHSQYSLLGVGMVFILGFYFTWLRIKYNSTTMAIVGHSVCNTLTMIALYWFE